MSSRITKWVSIAFRNTHLIDPIIKMWVYAIVSVILVSLISLIGILTLSLKEDKLNKIIYILVSLSVGGLFGDALIYLIPEAFKKSSNSLEVSLLLIAGILCFFVMEKFLRWRHDHHVEQSDKKIHPVGYVSLFTDALHNFVDGLLIGASYLVSMPIGITTTIAVMLHEIPHEIGDFVILIYAGFGRRKALWFNYLAATAAIFGAVLALLIGNKVEGLSNLIVIFAAGGFLYLAGSDMVPELHKENKISKSLVQFVAILAGIGLMFLMTFVK